MFHKIFDILSSLKLTVICLCLGISLVFLGTLAQVDLGLYEAQSRFFRHFLVYWTPAGSQLKIPVFPGGWLLGTVLVVNLLTAHIRRFKVTWKKSGIFMIHAGLIFLLLGQFLTELFQTESTMQLDQGEIKNYSDSSRYYELAVIDKSSSPNSDRVVSIPEHKLKAGEALEVPGFPFLLKVVSYFPNSEPKSVAAQPQKPANLQGIGKELDFVSVAQTSKMDDRNIPTARVEVLGTKTNLGLWDLSSWTTIEPLARIVKRQLKVGDQISEPQEFQVDGKTYEIALRPKRYYKPYSLGLVEFHHERYKGTEVPKNFASDIQLVDPASGVDRKVKIFMNNPLRYGGETYYQGSFDREIGSITVLQVVRNPAWLTPYLACSLVGAGLVTQFLMHLVGFARKSKQVGSPGTELEFAL